MRQTILLTVIFYCLLASVSIIHAADPEKPKIIQSDDQRMTDEAGVRRDDLLRSYLAQPPSLKAKQPIWDYCNFALAAYWFKERTPEADQAMITACNPELVRVRGSDNLPQNSGFYYRSVFFLERVYFLFNSRSEYFPGRMSPAAETAVREVLWKWASTACRKELFREDRVWWQPATENIGALLYSGLWGATQIFAEDPDYQNRHYADGTAVPGMARAFNDYYKLFLRERASKGLLVEVASSYNNGTLNGWYNIADFARDPVLRQRARMFLDLYWADWAIEQIDGVRGGSRHRCYPGGASTAGPGGGADGPSWYLFGLGKHVGLTASFPVIVTAATTFYRPSPVVADLVKDVTGRGTYAYISRRPGLGKSFNGRGDGGLPLTTDRDSFFAGQGGSILNPNGGNLLRYTWCTPDFVMGTSMVPALSRGEWSLISSQNHWDGVIFAGHPTARVFVQPSGHSYNADWSVQSKGVMIVQRLKDTNAKDQRVWFDSSLKRVERDGWVFAEAPQAYAAVRVAEGPTTWQPDESGKRAKGKRDEVAEDDPVSKSGQAQGMYLTCGNEFSPVILEVGRKGDYPSFTAFQNAILANALTWKDKKLDYRSDFHKTQLTLFADYSNPPQVDGSPVNHNPPKAYDSPFIQGDFGSGVITIRKDRRELLLDFTKELKMP